jgi:hypothetical protein
MRQVTTRGRRCAWSAAMLLTALTLGSAPVARGQGEVVNRPWGTIPPGGKTGELKLVNQCWETRTITLTRARTCSGPRRPA